MERESFQRQLYPKYLLQELISIFRGLEADQKVIAAHGCYAMTATTALTAQNTMGVVDIHYTPPEFVEKLIDASLSDIGVDVVKTGICLFLFSFIASSRDQYLTFVCYEGMLASAEIIKVVAKTLARYHVTKMVVDPVGMI